MKFGSRHDFHVVDGIGDAIGHLWRRRKENTLEDHTRRLIKFAALILTGVLLVEVLYPAQREGWLLWLGPKYAELSHWTAVVLVGMTAICLPLNRYAWHNGGGDRPLAVVGGISAACMLFVVFLGSANFYAATSTRAVGVATAALGGADNRIKEAEAALTALDGRTAASLAVIDSAIAKTSDGAPTGRSRLVAQRTAADAAAALERRRIEGELREARAASVVVNAGEPDPRPLDGFIAGMFGADRRSVAVTLDSFRSAVFDFMALVYVALGTTIALSRAGAPIVAETVGDNRMRIRDMRDAPTRTEDGEGEVVAQPYDRAVATAEFEDIEDGFHFVRGGKRKNPRRKSKPAFDENGVEAAATSSKLSDTGARPHPWTVPTNMAFEAGGPQEREDGNESDAGGDEPRSAVQSDLVGRQPDAGSDRAAAGQLDNRGRDGEDVSRPAEVERLAEQEDAVAREIGEGEAGEAGVHADDPAPLPAAEFDHLVAIGAIAEDGTPLSQEHVESIEQEDRSPKRPMLAAPVPEMADAK